MLARIKLSKRKIILLAGLLLAGILVLGSCGNTTEKSRKPQSGWSRGLRLGSAVTGSPGISVDETDGWIYLVWPFDEGEGPRLRYQSLDGSARPKFERDLEFPGQLRAPRLANALDGNQHLFWSSRVPGEQEWALYHVLINREGELLGEPLRISSDGETVGSYEVVADQGGGALIVWGQAGQRPVWLAHLAAQGNFAREPYVVVSQGEAPTLRRDEAGNYHLAWLQGAGMYYAHLAVEMAAPVEGARVLDLNVGTGQSLNGPLMGVADDWVYLFWSKLNQAGMMAGTATTEYVAFRSGGAQGKLDVRPVMILADEVQDFVALPNQFNLEELVVPPNESWQTTDFVQSPATMQNSTGQLAVAVAADQMYRQNSFLQIAVLIFADGQPVGYSYASKTEGISDDPVLYNDANGQLYVAWREGAGGTRMYFSSSATRAVATLNRLTLGDLTNAFLQGGIESFVSVIFTPIIGFGWLLPGLLVMGVWKMIKDDEHMGDPATWAPLLLSLLIFQAIKYITLPTIVSYVPFSAWMEIPAFLAPLLRVGVPILILLAAFRLANLVRQRRSESAALFYVVFCLADAVLSLAIYGVNFLGVY